jgi:hypothetical protein
MTMIDLTVRTLEASTKTIPLDTVASLRSKLRGTVALPGDDGYDLPALSEMQWISR